MPTPAMVLGRINLLLPPVRRNPFKNFLPVEKKLALTGLSLPLILFGKPSVLFKTSYYPTVSS
jgi:hypothetical protein